MAIWYYKEKKVDTQKWLSAATRYNEINPCCELDTFIHLIQKTKDKSFLDVVQLCQNRLDYLCYEKRTWEFLLEALLKMR